MRILMITFEFPPQPGGVGTYSYQLAKHLSRLGNTVTVLANTNYMSETCIADFDLRDHPFQIIRYRRYRNKLAKIFHRIWLTWKVFRRKKFDLLFIPYAHAGILGWGLQKLYGIPYVMMGHGSEFLYRNPVLAKVIKMIFEGANLVLVNSHYTAQLVQKRITNRNLMIIPLGADDEIYDYKKYSFGDIKSRYNVSGRKIILTVGSLSERKGHRFVIEAIKFLKADFPEILYLIVGRGSQENQLQQLIAVNNLEEHVRLIGFVPTEKLPEYYALCDVFILNSTIDHKGDVEGFGIVLIEANLMGKPVIGTRDSGMEEAIEHGKNGLLIPMNNIEATVWALRELLANPVKAQEMGEYGYRRAKREMTWKKVAEKTNRALKEVLTNGARRKTLTS
ncbi:MAG: glycosyltransferase family 1 protein [Calditrichaeota bacterium]|nr:MAG: glycosyltransferase family 1 protein [Calditrichota bacterium]